MEKRVPPSMRTRQALSELIEGRLASPDGRAELVKLATRLIVEGEPDQKSIQWIDFPANARGGVPGRARPRLLRARRRGRPGLS